ncbi:macrophage mannose receptor 1-like protein, partial [Leptotrombidium deliense]
MIERVSMRLNLSQKLNSVIGTCPIGWYQYKDKCFFVYNRGATYAEFTAFCAKLQATAISIHSREEEEFLIKILKNNGNWYWIGLYRWQLGQKVFGWRDGTQSKYQHWNTNEPNEVNDPNAYCVSVNPDNNFLWFDEN